ncbi:hypothetical protein QBC42DRAFT_280698 [Cladorrhinum samala]|uniref:Uncharacterized protein n=1 Tax=Cladorrhinum samala TaxID=585594 RepID=A0AAV9HAA9_9PEZI|nr:hypothetical protein QBC42DRAFT_280698 [Cladorrhinum samala]
MSTTGSESVPLLAAVDGPGPIHLRDTAAKRNLFRLRIGHRISLFLAHAVIGLAVTTEVKLRDRPSNYRYPESISEATSEGVICSIVTILWSAGNLVRFRHSGSGSSGPGISRRACFFVAIVHYYVVIYLNSTTVRGVFDLVRHSGCGSVHENDRPEPNLLTPPPPPDPECLEWRRRFEPWVWTYLVCLGVFVFAHTFLSGTYLSSTVTMSDCHGHAEAEDSESQTGKRTLGANETGERI